MAQKLFGTDGVRGVANEFLTPELAFAIGAAAGNLLRQGGGRKRALIGRDTRQSGSMLGAALASGLCSSGVDVVTVGVAPTGAISWIARTAEFDLAAVISASHNPAPDNGIKLIAHDGRKVAEAFEREIESALGSPAVKAVGGDVGKITPGEGHLKGYAEFLETLVPEKLDGMRIAVDGSHGAAYEIAPTLFRSLGAEVTVTGCEPDGMNINAGCGATRPETIQTFTLETSSHIGIAFDGDADRAVFSDERGNLFNGDRTMALWCAHWAKHGRFDPPVAVGTVMSNGGFERYVRAQGARLERTDVGDKYVSARMLELGAKVGGEQSGHIIFSERGPTGDGLITALELLRVLKREERSASSFYGDYEAMPQALVNISVASKEAFRDSSEVKAEISEAEAKLAGSGRINVRPSGTQPMVRVMVEAETAEIRDQVIEKVVAAIQSHVGGEIYSRVELTHALGD